MKKFSIYFLLILLLIANTFKSKADEGMWLPNLIKDLNYTDMEKLGCKLSPQQIYDINNSSMKDAIFQLIGDMQGQHMGFCTGEIVSKEGLMFTNHHCGYESIAKLSSVGKDFLTDGFWAKSKAEELAVPGLEVSRVVRIEDVTKDILKDVVDGMEESKRKAAISKVIAALEKKAIEGTHFSAKVKEMYKGGEYYLFVFEVFKDVRMVGAPPTSIGKFGGDTDNWIWPRHTGDFSIFRVYMGKDGKPAPYSKDNIPYKPLHYLPISLKGIKEGDFTMTMGFPGTTDRYLTSAGMNFRMNTMNPIIVKLFGKKLEIMKQYIDTNDSIRIAVSDDYASLANTWKNFKGVIQNLKQTDAISTKKKEELEFMNWVNATPERIKKYGKVLTNLDSSYAAYPAVFKPVLYSSIGLMQGGQQVMKVMQFFSLQGLLADQKNKKDQIAESIKVLREKVDSYFEKYYVEMDKKSFTAALKIYAVDMKEGERIKFFNEGIIDKYKGNSEAEKIDKFVEAVYTKSIFTNKQRMLKFLDKPALKTLNNDPLFTYTLGLMKEVQFGIQATYLVASKKIDLQERLFIEGFREFKKDSKFYPDANGTLRLSYGTVKPYEPRDGAFYKYETFVEGIMEKRDETNSEFKVPPKLVDLINKKDFGQYADENGRMHVAFLSTNDITGGNSGSPVINANGELIGLAFDGNWEWVTSDLLFNDKLQRCINVDIRYVLFVIDKLGGAKNIIDELTIVK